MVTGTAVETTPGAAAVTAVVTGTAVETTPGAAAVTAVAAVSEVQDFTLAGALAVGDQFKVTLATGTVITGAALTAATLADLVEKLNAAVTGIAVTFSANDSKLRLTFPNTAGDVGNSTFTQLKVAGSTIS